MMRLASNHCAKRREHHSNQKQTGSMAQGQSDLALMAKPELVRVKKACRVILSGWPRFRRRTGQGPDGSHQGGFFEHRPGHGVYRSLQGRAVSDWLMQCTHGLANTLSRIPAARE